MWGRRKFWLSIAKVSFNKILRGVHASLLPIAVLLFSICSVPILPEDASAEKQTIKIGVLAYKGKDVALKMWTSTGTYLQSQIPDFSFMIIPLSFDDIDTAVRNHDVDFIIANSSIYVELESNYGVSRIATMRNRGFKGSSTAFGGAIFCKASRSDIKTLSDLKGKTFCATDETSLGGWRAAWRELHNASIEPLRDFSKLTFLDNHESVVYAVRDGKADAGTARTDTLERMAEEGKIAIGDFLILNSQQVNGFPFLLSTRLYPEWPIARLEKTPEEISRRVAIALLSMPPESTAVRDSKTAGWTIPLDYHPVHDLMKELRLGPYKDYGKVTLSQSLRQYWYLPLMSILALALMTAVIMHILKLNRHILTAKQEVDYARSDLEQKVVDRTAELRNLNKDLVHEIAARKESEERLLLAEKELADHLLFLQSVIDSVPDPVMVISPDYRVKLMNSAAKGNPDDNTFCYQISHKTDSPCSDDSHPCPLRHVMKTKRPMTVIHTHMDNGGQGQEIIVEITASPIFDSAGNVAYVIEICRDITERVRQEQEQKKIEKKLFDQQKEESIATLAGGIAHDFNNILMGVLGNAELLKMRLPLKPDENRSVESIIAGAERMADLTRQLLAYAKEGKYQLKLMSLNRAINKALDLSHKGKAIGTKTLLDLPDDLWTIMADENQIIQAFFNLFNNAFEATAESGGTLSIIGKNISAKPSWICQLHHEHFSGDYIHIAISDTGPGIPHTIADKVFEPFVTTKFMGRGLGLSAVLGIIQNHDGCITFSSEAGKGTTFDIFIPRSEGNEQTTSGQRVLAASSVAHHILLIDDEQNILQMLQEGLSSLGYNVTSADSGEKALQSFRALSEQINVAILDLQLPGMSGKAILKGLKAMKPDLKIIISTGYDRATGMGEISPYIPEGFIQKPYKLSVLQETLREILPVKP